MGNGADLERTTAGLQTPLHLACAHADATTTDLLLKEGARHSVADEKDQTPLHLAAQVGAVECVKILLGAGAKGQLTTKDNKTALQLATANEHDDVAELLRASRQGYVWFVCLFV